MTTMSLRLFMRPAVALGLALAASVPALANPGPNCTLATPTDKADCATVTMVIGGRTTSLDPVSGGFSHDYQPMYPQQGLLYRYDINLVPRMDLIEAETISPDGLTITQTIRKGAKYSDGTPVLAFEPNAEGKQARRHQEEAQDSSPLAICGGLHGCGTRRRID